MSEQNKNFSTLAVAGIITGYTWDDHGFGPIHEAAEWVMGHALWTHEFALKTVWEALRVRVLAQHPDLVEMDTYNVKEISTEAPCMCKRWPDGIVLQRGCEVRTSSPLETLAGMVGKDKP